MLVRLFISDDLRRSRLGEALLGDRWRPALIVAAAWRDARDGDLGEGGLGREASAALIEMRLGRCESGEPGIEVGLEVGRVLMSGAIWVQFAAEDVGW